MISKKFRELANKRQYFQCCPGVPIHILSAALSGFKMRKIGMMYSAFLFDIRDDYLKMCYMMDDLENLGKAILENLEKDSKYLEKIRKIYGDDMMRLVNLFEKIDRLNLIKINDNELFELIKKSIDAISDSVGVGHIIEPYALTTDEKLKQSLAKYINDPKEVNKKFILLTTPSKKSFANEAEESIAKIANASNKDKLIGQHIKKFWWIRNSYAGARSLTKKEVLEESRSYRNKIFIDLKKISEEKKKTIKELKLPSTIVSMLKITEFLTIWQDERKKNILMTIGYFEKLLSELSKRTGIDISLLRYATPDDFNKNIIKLKSVFEERRKGAVYVWAPNYLEVISGDDYIAAHNLLKTEDTVDTEMLNGTAASLGVAVGKVKVCTSLKSIDEVENGDILIASMTRPEYVPAMKKAAAIVTDEGGITCHAAIVARELKKPCVIGTKIATKALKDGDLVEVNGNHGAVKILKRAA